MLSNKVSIAEFCTPRCAAMTPESRKPAQSARRPRAPQSPAQNPVRQPSRSDGLRVPTALSRLQLYLYLVCASFLSQGGCNRTHTFGLTPRKYRSAAIDVTGSITKAGDAMVHSALYEAAHSMLARVRSFSNLKRWAIMVAKRRGLRRATVALARKLAIVLHRMWMNGTDFRFGEREMTAA